MKTEGILFWVIFLTCCAFWATPMDVAFQYDEKKHECELKITDGKQCVMTFVESE